MHGALHSAQTASVYPQKSGAITPIRETYIENSTDNLDSGHKIGSTLAGAVKAGRMRHQAAVGLLQRGEDPHAQMPRNLRS